MIVTFSIVTLGKNYAMCNVPKNYCVAGKWAQLAGPVALIGSSLLQGNFAVLPILKLGSSYIQYCCMDLGIFYGELVGDGERDNFLSLVKSD